MNRFINISWEILCNVAVPMYDKHRGEINSELNETFYNYVDLTDTNIYRNSMDNNTSLLHTHIENTINHVTEKIP
jgi:hypothetical protein